MHPHPASRSASHGTPSPCRSLPPVSALLLAATVVAVAACADDAVAPPTRSAQPSAATAAASAERYLVGAYYASLWWRMPGSLVHYHNVDSSGSCVDADGAMAKDWRPCYPGRQPLVEDVVGDEFPDDPYTWYDDQQEYVDEQIKMAAAGGIDFFAFEYFTGQGKDGEFVGCCVPVDGFSRNNNGLKFFMRSPNNGLMRFALLYTNLDKFAIERSDYPGGDAVAAWRDTVSRWADTYFRHDRYLRINGKPVLMIINATGMRSNWGAGLTANAADSIVAERLSDIRRAAAKAGFPGVLIGGGISRPDRVAIERVTKHGYDFLTSFSSGFLEPSVGCDDFAGQTEYERLTEEFMECFWGRFRTLAPETPYAPVVIQGWDRRPTGKPFEDDSDEPYFVNKTAELFARQLMAARQFVDAGPRLPSGQRMVVIYAWNELAEGGMLIPNKGEGFDYLNRVKEVFP